MVFNSVSLFLVGSARIGSALLARLSSARLGSARLGSCWCLYQNVVLLIQFLWSASTWERVGAEARECRSALGSLGYAFAQTGSHRRVYPYGFAICVRPGMGSRNTRSPAHGFARTGSPGRVRSDGFARTGSPGHRFAGAGFVFRAENIIKKNKVLKKDECIF